MAQPHVPAYLGHLKCFSLKKPVAAWLKMKVATNLKIKNHSTKI